MDSEIKHKKGNEGRFYIGDEDDILGFVEYSIEGNLMIIQHTEVTEKLQGTGSARKLVDAAVKYGKEKGYEMEATCSYAANVLKRYYS